MVIKGTSCGGARRLAFHLSRTDSNERAEVKELRGVTAADLRGALLEMEAVAAGARTAKPFYHGSINTRADERLTDAQRMQAIDRLEAALGLSGQPRVVVVHEKDEREHCHVVWSRVLVESMAAVSDSHNYRKHEQVARQLEREFGHERVQGAHVEREERPRPKRTPSHAEMLQGERTGISPTDARLLMTELWRSTDSGRAFADALDRHGWILARGDRRDFVVIDPKGGVHSLARRIEGATANDVRERLADIDAGRLPSVSEARKVHRSRQTGANERGRTIPRADLGWKPAQATVASRDANGPDARREDHWPGPGVESGPHYHNRRASSKRGTAGNGGGGFSAGFSRGPLVAGRLSLTPVPEANEIRFWSTTEAHTCGEFRAAAFWINVQASSSGDAGDGIADASDSGADDELAQILDAIVADVQRKAAGARAAVIAECAGKVNYARLYLPPHQIAGALRAFKDAQAAALAYIAKEASGEIAIRREAVIRAHRKECRPMRPSVGGGEQPDRARPNQG